MVYCVEILAIYEAPGANVTNQRRNQRNSDFNSAQTEARKFGHSVPPQADEVMVEFDPPDRYGMGWRCRQWIAASADAVTIGQAIFGTLSGRNLKPGSKVQVFPEDNSQPGYTTLDVVYQRVWPTPNPDDVG